MLYGQTASRCSADGSLVAYFWHPRILLTNESNQRLYQTSTVVKTVFPLNFQRDNPPTPHPPVLQLRWSSTHPKMTTASVTQLPIASLGALCLLTSHKPSLKTPEYAFNQRQYYKLVQELFQVLIAFLKTIMIGARKPAGDVTVTPSIFVYSVWLKKPEGSVPFHLLPQTV